MDSMEKWNSIVEYHNKHYHDKEQTVQSIWENIFAEMLGYSRLGNEVERHRHIRIGSTERVISDIIVKNGSTDLFVVELKQHNLSLNTDMEGQLFTYLQRLRIDIGIIICDRIYIYEYDHGKGDDCQDKTMIDFISDNPSGKRFIELFSKDTFSKSAVNDFISQQLKSTRNIEAITNELTSGLVIDLLSKYFMEKYEAVEIEQALEKINISVSPIVNFTNTSTTISNNGFGAYSHTNEMSPAMSYNVNDQRTQRGGNEQAVFSVLSGLQANGKIDENLLNKLKSVQYTNQTFKVSSFPFLLPVNELGASGFERNRFYKRSFVHNGVEYFVCSQWIPVRMALLDKWYSEIMNG